MHNECEKHHADHVDGGGEVCAEMCWVELSRAVRNQWLGGVRERLEVGCYAGESAEERDYWAGERVGEKEAFGEEWCCVWFVDCRSRRRDRWYDRCVAGVVRLSRFWKDLRKKLFAWTKNEGEVCFVIDTETNDT
jgi:hypothetical protein